MGTVKELVGKTFGQYRVVRLLGRGAMGEVYEVEHRMLGRKYALKLLPEGFGDQTEAVQRFEREAKVMVGLDHPRIVRMDDFGEVEGRYWVRMELVKGLSPHVVTLGDYAAERGWKIEQGEFALILKQILEGLAYAHRKGVAHRDLKPGNILLEKDASDCLMVKVTDFGLARAIGEKSILSQIQAVVSSGGGGGKPPGPEGDQAPGSEEGGRKYSLAATWDYMAPEQQRGDEADARSDVYALGVMCYRLLTGKRLVDREASRPDAALSAEWQGFVARALESEVTARFGNGQEMLEAFDQREAAAKPETPSPEPEEAPPEPVVESPAPAEVPPADPPVVQRRRSRTWAVAGGAVVLAAALAVGVWQFGVKPRRAAQARQAAAKLGELAAASGPSAAGQDRTNRESASPPGKGVEAVKPKAAKEIVAKAEEKKKEPEPEAAGSPSQASEKSRATTGAPAGRGKERAWPEQATEEKPWTNSLGQPFVPVPGTKALFCVWDARVQDFEAFVTATSYDASAGMSSLGADGWKERGGSWRSPGFSQGPEYPVCGVNWDDAKAFCAWLTKKELKEGVIGQGQAYRLPKDAEWSLAAGLEEKNEGAPQDKSMKIPDVYPWGKGWPPPSGAGNYAGEEAKDESLPPGWGVITGYWDGYTRTSPVGSFKVNRYGLYDMGGNVWQWCEDYCDGRTGGRVLRGGAWINVAIPESLLSSYRLSCLSDVRQTRVGFRPVLANDAR